jgi:hypothetical protein
MLSLDLFNSKYERELREGAVDQLEMRRIDILNDRMQELLTRAKEPAYKKNPAAQAGLKRELEKIKAERDSYYKIREQQVPSKQDPFAYVKPEPKGIGDIQDPKAKMAQLQQRAKKGALANVGAGLKAFIKGEPEPMDEEQELGRRGIGMSNMKALQDTVEKGFARTIFQFPNIKYVVGEDDTDKMADYYNGQDAAGRTNFVYNVLGDGMKFVQLCRELGIQPTPVEPQQPELPGMPQANPQGQLPLQEKKKSDNNSNIEAGDVKVARELQKLRAEYPAARSDIEAVARAEIDSTERSQRQLSAIRGANEKQDALLKQLVDLDKEQGREIDGLDQENNSLEQRLAQVQATNDRLQQAVGQMTGTKKSNRPAVQKTTTQSGTGTIDLMPGAPADQQKVVPIRKPAAKPVALRPATPQPVAQPATPEPVPVDPTPELPSNVIPLKKYNPPEQLTKLKKAAESRVSEGQPQELIHRYLAIDAENDVDAVRKAIQAISRDPELGVTSKSRLLGQIGMIIKRHRLPIGRSYYQFMQQYMEEQSVTETVENVRAGMAQIYRRLAPKIERHRDSFLAGQLYDELENYAELHGAEREFKQMMNSARNRAHMEYDTNPGGFHNWFWFLPFADEQVEEVKADPTGSWVVYNGSKVLKFKTHSGAKAYAEKNGGKVASSEYHQDKVQKQGVAESTDDIKKRMSKLEALALAANRAGDDAKCKMYQQKIQSLKQKLSQSMNEFDASGYSRYSIYMDDYDLEEKFSDLDDAVEAIEAYKRDDPKSRYADYNVRDLNGKVVWRNDAWQDVPKPGKIQFLPPKTETIDSRVSTNTEQQWMQSMKQQYPGVKFAQNKTTMQIFAMAPGKGKVGTFDPRQQVTEFEVADLVRPGAQTDTPPRRAYSIALQGRPGKDFRAEYAWKALNSVFPKEYPADADTAEQKVAEVTKRGSAIVKTGIASEDIADTYVAKLSRFVPGQFWKIVGGELEEATGDSKFDAMMGKISKDPWTQLNSDPNWEYEIEELVDQHIEPWLLAMEKSGMPITRDNKTLNPGWRKRYEQVSTQLAQKYLAAKKFNPRDPDLVGKIRAAIDNHTDQSRNVAGQLSAYADDLPLHRYADAFDADGMTANIRDALAGLAPRDDDDDDGYAPRPRPEANPRRLDPGNMEESSKPGEYYVHTVYFKDGTKKRIRVTSDEFDVADYYNKRGQAVDRVDYDFQLHSEELLEGIKDTASATAVIACLLTGGSLTGCATAPQQTSAQQVLKTGQDIGRTVQTAKRITRAGTEAEVQQELRNILRGVSGRPEELNHSNILRIWRRVNEPKPQQNEAREIVSKEDFVRERDRLLRMIGQETNPANKQILKSAIRQLENRAEQEGWLTIQQRMIREENDSQAVEQAILKRIMVAHTDLLRQYGPQKVMQAAEEVAYNVGDVDEIGTSDVSAYVQQVKQILGATP